MAELAIGISKSVLEALVNKAQSAIKDEAEKWQIMEHDIRFIKDEFQTMQSFLKTASGRRMNNEVVMTWVRQVRDLSYDTEDCIEFVLHLDTKSKPSFWWQSLFLRSLWQGLLCSDRARTIPLDQAIAEIKQLKARAENVEQMNIRYGGVISNSEEQVLRTSADSQRTIGSFINQRYEFGNQNDIVDLTELIRTNGEGLQVISVYGIGDNNLGTASIIKKAYDDPAICRMFECRAWVKVTHPFNPYYFIRSLMAGFYANSPSQGKGSLAQFVETLVQTLDFQDICEEQEPDVGPSQKNEADVIVHVLAMMEATQDNIIKDFIDMVKKKPYLIVLEDLSISSIAEWKCIRTFMPDMNNRSRIVVSTKQLEIARLCTGKPNHKWPLRELADHSVYAFFKELPKSQQGSERQTLCRTPTQEHTRGLQNPGPTHWQEHHHLFGRTSEITKLGRQIGNAYARKASVVISVFGIAGVGKSFLVGAFYDHFAEIFDSCAVVSASQPFSINMFCDNLLHHLNLPEGEDDVSDRIWKHLEEKQCLVVIDDLRSKEHWDLIKGNLILTASKSCIIVITREESIARHCATSDNAVCRVKGLKADSSRSLFEKETRSLGRTANWDSDMMDEAGLIVNKCGRLPKLSVALVKYLAEERNGIREARRLNDNFMYALKTSKGLDTFRDVFNWMYSNFKTSPQLLKKCVFYLSIFTQSSMIRQSRLVRRWIAEGYSEGTNSNSIVEYTEKLIHELANLGMMEYSQHAPTTAAGETSCQINSLFLEYVISRESEENILFIPLEVSVLQGEGSLNTLHVGQHLTIGSSWKRDKFVFDKLDLSRLRSLTVSREWKPFLVSDRMRVLRVLDLEDTNVADDDIEQVVKQLPRLRFLGLRGCIRVTCLPDSLGDLSQLQTLDIRHTSVIKLPKSTTKLQKLQYIRAASRVAFVEEQLSAPRRSNHGRRIDPCDGITVPRGIGALMALHTLGVVNVSRKSGMAILMELRNLTQLKKLGVSGINRSNIKGLFSAIEGHIHLESLTLQLHKDKDLEWLGKITPPRKLRFLKMYVHLVKYPDLSSLKVLGKIKRLHTLSLRFETDQDVELQFFDRLDRNPLSTFGQFSELKVLEIACSSNLHVRFAEREMQELEILKIHCLNGSSLQLSGIDRFPPSLKHVWLNGSFDDAVKDELRRNVAQHPKKPFLQVGPICPRDSH